MVQTAQSFVSSSLLLLSIWLSRAVAFDNTRYDNLAVYWGQNSYGATHSSDVANWQQRLSFYCGSDSTIDAFPVAFLDEFFGPANLPSINLANTCNPTDNATFAGSELPNCSALASDIETCQAAGKIVTISLGGATGAVGFSSDSQAESFADTIWNVFLGGSSSTRPFGSAVLDGVDLDIEGGGSTSYPAFVNRIRSHASGASKKYYITAAPQCPFPDANLGSTLNSAEFDAVYVQFYNNFCGLTNFNTVSDWNFGVWDNWAHTTSPNPDVKIYIGAPASSTAAGSGYVDASTLSSIATQMRKAFPSFGGVMLWDASQAYANDRFDKAIKSALTAAGGTGFTFPACSAPAYVAGNTYTSGQQVTYNGYIWEAEFFSDTTPGYSSSSSWSAVSACGGPASAPPSSTSSHSSSSSSASSSSSSSSHSTSTSSAPSGTGSCASVSAWQAGVAYTAGEEATYGGDLWKANWWTEGDAPNTINGDWTNVGPCTSVAATPAPAAVSSSDDGHPASVTPASQPKSAATSEAPAASTGEGTLALPSATVTDESASATATAAVKPRKHSRNFRL